MGLTTFAIQAVADFRTVGAIAPSSRYLAHAMLGPLPLDTARLVVELGPGTGAMTHALLALIPGDATLLAFEINPRFSSYLKTRISDRRLVVVNRSAETLQKEVDRLGYERADAVVSSLALGLMSDAKRCAFLSALPRLLGEAGVFTQYQYVHRLQVRNRRIRKFCLAHLLRAYFSSVQQTTIWRNLPPAFVFACRGARPFTSARPASLPRNSSAGPG